MPMRAGLSLGVGTELAVEDGQLVAERLVLGAQAAVVGQQRLVALA